MKARAARRPANSVSRFFARVLLSLLVINFATISALIYVAYSFSTESLSKHAEEGITQQVDLLVDKFHAEYRDALNRALHNLVEAPVLDDYLLGSKAERLVLSRRMERLFLQQQKDYPIFHTVYFVDSDGRIAVCARAGRRCLPEPLSTGDQRQPERSHAEKLFEELRDTPLLLTSASEPMEWFMPPREPRIVGPFVTGSGIPAVVAGLGKLDKDTGLFGGVIMIQMNLDRWIAELRALRFFDVNSVWLLDMNGKVLLQPEDPRATFDPREDLPAGTDAKTHRVEPGQGLAVYHDLAIEEDQPLLRVVVSLPSDLLLHGISHAVDFFSFVVDFYAIVVAVSVVLLAALSYVIAQFLARPVLDLAIARNQLANAQRIARIGHWELNGKQNTVHVSDNVAAMLGRQPDDLDLNLDAFLELVHPDDVAPFKRVLENARTLALPGSIEHRLCVKGVEQRYVHQEIDVVRGEKLQIIGTIQDVTERKRAEEQIRELAYLDSVTGLANRTLLNEIAAQALKTAEKAGTSVGVVFLDLDNFKRINDTFGHEAGDELLRQVARRLTHSVRPTDSVTPVLNCLIPEKAVARLGGDEFIVLLPELHHEDHVIPIATRIQATLARPFNVAGKEILVTGSLGISLFPNHGDTIDDLLKHADAAMYQAKAKGRNRFEVYTALMDHRIKQRLSIEMRLHSAIESGEFVLYYQPRVDMKSGRIVAVEALIRWIDSESRIITPECFIAIAEETGMIIPLGAWVLRSACTQLRAWHQTGAPDIKVSVNLSPIQFSAPDIITSIIDIIKDTGVDSRFIELELTENALFEDIETGTRCAHDLKAYGLQLSIDDFGTGYSSLQLLKRLPVDILKIDQCFIRDIVADEEDALIVKSAIALGQGLGIRVVAEGVELQEQLDLLRELGCDEVQGYLLGRPAPAHEVYLCLAEDAGDAMTIPALLAASE